MKSLIGIQIVIVNNFTIKMEFFTDFYLTCGETFIRTTNFKNTFVELLPYFLNSAP